ncbi:MAG: hypothetical protein RLN87_13770 [Parasphingopyxis sp.]|uniref:hypothetical protein n=1 Tax=Parasphingopyxis sp. TaxID=1920299 RepID=UPI0032EEAAA6
MIRSSAQTIRLWRLNRWWSQVVPLRGMPMMANRRWRMATGSRLMAADVHGFIAQRCAPVQNL